MRILHFDQFEFETPASEETLRIAVAATDQFSTPEEFVAACPRNGTANFSAALDAIPMTNFKRASEVIEYLRRFACLSDLAHEDATVTVLHDEWCELEVVI